MAAIVYPFLRKFTSLISDKWLSVDVIPHVTVPILFISGLADSLVPPRFVVFVVVIIIIMLLLLFAF